MLPIIIKLILSFIMNVSAYIIVKKILNHENKVSLLKLIFTLILLASPTIILYDVKYNIIYTLLVYIMMSISFKYLFKTDIVSSVLSCGYVMLSTAFADIIITTIETNFFTYEEVRNLNYIVIFNNILVCTICILLVRNSSILKLIKTSIKKIEYNNKIKSLFFTILTIIVLATLYYNITKIFEINFQYIITMATIYVFFILYYIYLKERNNYEKLKDQYNIIFNYFNTFENWIDNEQFYRHELKNNLSIIRNLTNKKSIKNKIDEMLNMNIIIDEKDINLLKTIPSGGLKGLLYYKIAIAKKSKVQVIIDVGANITEALDKMDSHIIKKICIILGIYIDNAIEEASKLENNNVTIEIYKTNKSINFVISNKFTQIIAIKNMQKKGFSTKKENRGKGLYYANRILNKEDNITSKQQYMNNYFIQKIIIGTTLNSKKK